MKATRPRTSITGQSRARLRTQLLRSSSVIAMVTVLGTAHVNAQTLSVLHAAQASANAAIAAKYPNGMPPSLPGNKNGSNSAGMAGAQIRALQYVAARHPGVDMGMQAQARGARGGSCAGTQCPRRACPGRSRPGSQSRSRLQTIRPD